MLADCNSVRGFLFISVGRPEQDPAGAVIFIFNSTNSGELCFIEGIVDTQLSKVFLPLTLRSPISKEIENENRSDKRGDTKNDKSDTFLAGKMT